MDVTIAEALAAADMILKMRASGAAPPAFFVDPLMK